MFTPAPPFIRSSNYFIYSHLPLLQLFLGVDVTEATATEIATRVGVVRGVLVFRRATEQGTEASLRAVRHMEWG